MMAMDPSQTDQNLSRLEPMSAAEALYHHPDIKQEPQAGGGGGGGGGIPPHHQEQHVFHSSPHHPQQLHSGYPPSDHHLHHHHQQQQLFGMAHGVMAHHDGGHGMGPQDSPQGNSPQGSKPRQSSKYGFRFLKHERAQLEKWYRDNEGRTAPITIRKDWVMQWNNTRKQMQGQQQICCEVTHQQVKQWFENMRRTRNHKSRPTSRLGSPGLQRGGSGSGGVGLGAAVGGGGASNLSSEPAMNPRLYLAASTGKMHTAIDKSSQIISKHIEQLQQITNSPLSLSPNSREAAAVAAASMQQQDAAEGDQSQFRWDAINLQVIVDKLLSLLDNQIHNPSLPSPTTTVTPQQEFHFRVFKQLLDIDRQVEPEWKALKEISAALEVNPTQPETNQQAAELVDLYMMKLEHIITEKTKVMLNLICHLNILPNPNEVAPKGSKDAAATTSSLVNKPQEDPEEARQNAAWTTSWTIPPGILKRKSLDSKLCVFEGCFLNDEQRANFFLGVPVHASALASAVCFSLESGDSERLTSQEAQNLVSLYEVAAVQELELSEQLDKLWNLRPLQEDVTAVNSWRSWLQDHHNPETYYPLKVLADAVPAADQQYGFVSVTRNSLVLSLGFLKGLRYALPLPLFTKCMINFTQAHYLFAAAAMLEELSVMVSGGSGPDQDLPPDAATTTAVSAGKEQTQQKAQAPTADPQSMSEDQKKVEVEVEMKEEMAMQAKEEEEEGPLPEAKENTSLETPAVSPQEPKEVKKEEEAAHPEQVIAKEDTDQDRPLETE